MWIKSLQPRLENIENLHMWKESMSPWVCYVVMQILFIFLIHQRFFLKSFIFVSDGQRILSCGADHFMRVLDVHTGTEVYCKDVGEEIR